MRGWWLDLLIWTVRMPCQRAPVKARQSQRKEKRKNPEDELPPSTTSSEGSELALPQHQGDFLMTLSGIHVLPGLQESM